MVKAESAKGNGVNLVAEPGQDLQPELGEALERALEHGAHQGRLHALGTAEPDQAVTLAG